MAERSAFGYPVGQLIMAAIILTAGVFTLVLVTADEETVLYAGIAIGVALVLFAGVVSYVATRTDGSN